MNNYLTIDVEDYYQVSGFEKEIGYGKWVNFSSRVVENTTVILNILDEYNVKATFFILGWTAEKFPELVQKIVGLGHEIGCHSYRHGLVYDMSPEEFRQDTMKAKATIERAGGKKVLGYRAPSYSVTNNSLWALEVLEELGFQYDSSIFPILHDRYGIPDAPRFEYVVPGRNLKEYPISTVKLLGRNFPVSGGGYFRLFPYWFTRMALRKINNQERRPFIFYLHPWEIDPEQPRIAGASRISKFRHYVNIGKTEERFRKLLHDFSFVPISGSR